MNGLTSMFGWGGRLGDHGSDPEAESVGTVDVAGALLKQLHEVALEADVGQAGRAAFEVCVQLRRRTGIRFVLEIVLQGCERLLAIALGWLRGHVSRLGVM